VQREPIERRAQRLVEGQGLRLEEGEAAHPLRPGRRGLAKDRRGGEIRFRIALPALFRLVIKGPQPSAPA
jgi:hypothetical protein